MNLLYHEGVNRDLGRTSIAVLTCPDDFSVEPGQGNLSYVVSVGFATIRGCPYSWHFLDPPIYAPLDLNGNGITCPSGQGFDGTPSDNRLMFQLGLFHGENWPPGSGGVVRYHTLDTVRDGLSYTIMLGECIRAGYDPSNKMSIPANWACPLPWYNGFFVSSYVCQDRVCSAGNVDYRRANDRTDPRYRVEAINGDLNQAEGEAPWLMSGHVGGANVVFCDGHIIFLSEEVDGGVYAALVSPQGTLVRGPMAQPLVVDGSY
jgi:prepilin-type processing-associated H-X9-DG protein